jgi:predicted Co/Zn/Cd cation transporter (cation efflux family)
LGILKMTPLAKQTLLGPAVVGVLFGLFVGCCSFAFDSEYSAIVHPQLYPAWLYAALQAALWFTLTAGGVLFIFGVIPLLIAKATAK